MARTINLLGKQPVIEPVPELDVSDLGELLLAKRADGRSPLSGSIELTTRCNLTCQHCYINEAANDRAVRSKEMTTEQIKRVIEQAVAEGGLFLTLTGGEVLLRPDFREIYLFAREKGLLVTIFSNATLITPKIADFLAEYPPVAVEVTMYGYSEATYEEVTGIKGSYVKFRRGLALLHERGLVLKLKTVVMTLNEHEFEQMKAFAEELTGQFAYDTAIFARLDGGKQPCALRIPAEHVVELDVADPKQAAELQEVFGRQAPISEYTSLYRCGAALNSWHVNAEGGVAGCTISKPVDYNLKEGNFSEAWNGPLKAMRNLKKHDLFTKCRTCEVSQYCTICPAKALLESGNPEFQIDYLCQVAELRAQVLGGKRKLIPLAISS